MTYHKPSNYGPWATSLDAGSRLQLSAFWKQRMRRLPELASTRQMSRRSVVAALVLAMVIGISPLVELVPAAPAEVAAEGDFVATFSNGVSVELIGLSENPSAQAPWWKPDGTPLEGRPYERSMARMKSTKIPREICWRWRGIGKADVQTRWGLEPSYNGAGDCRPKDTHGKSIPGLTAWAVSLTGSPETCTVKLSMSVPATPWGTQFEIQAGNPSSTSRLLPNGERGAVSFMAPRVDGNDTLVTMGYQIANEVRLAAIDRDGKVHVGKSKGGGGVNGFVMSEVRFANVIPGKLKTWQLQTRQRKTETAEFRNVSLHRGKATDVETVMVVEKLTRPADQTAAKEFPRLEFGKVVEKTLDIQAKASLDLDTGRLVTVPEVFNSKEQANDWFVRNGVDVAGIMELGFEGLTGFDLIAMPLSAELWDMPWELVTRVDYGKPGSPVPISGQGALPATYQFKTREGNRGVLQILEITDERAVKIRYKLLAVPWED